MSSQNKEEKGGKVNGSRVVHHATIYAKSQMNDDDDDDKKRKKPSSSPYTLGTTAASSMYLYMECMKNHAASIGGNARDGCGEFMAGGEQGTLEALKCSACNCHRNFHRKIHHEQFQTTVVPLSSVPSTTPSSSSKRFRTKFNEEQKEKMCEFAEKCKWKIQRLEDSVVRSFCHEIGINRNVLKAWIHNNKYHQHNANSKNM